MEEYVGHWSVYTVPKKTIMTAPGSTEKHMYFVLEGVQKSYYLFSDKAHVIAFSYPPSFSGIPESFLSQTPANYYLETLRESTFLRISFEKHQQMMEKYRPIETLFRKATEMVLVGTLVRQYEGLALDMKSRFEKFVKRSPHLLQMVPHKDIASYLRIDATNFSKLYNSVKI